jgi:hypothetical protein
LARFVLIPQEFAMLVRRPQASLVLACVAAAMACVPLLCARLPPLYDYPAHLARMRITADLLTQRHFAALYALHPAVVPNLATDMVVVPLVLAGLDVQLAGRLCLAALILGIGVGVVRLNRALLGGASSLPVLAFGLVYAEPFQFGFLNYVAGIAVLLNALAFWVPARGAVRLAAIGAVACVVLFFCHLIACVIFIAAVLTLEAFGATRARWRGMPPWGPVRRGAALLPGLLLTVALYTQAPLADTGAHDSFIREFLKHPPSKRERLDMLINAAHGYWPWLDLAGVLVLLLVGAVLWRRGRVRLGWAMLPVVAGMMVVYAVFPDHWAGTSYIADRLPFLIALLALASFDVAPVTRRGRMAFGALILALVAVRSASAALVWHAADRVYAPMIAALSALPDGTKIYTATIYRVTTKSELSQPFTHIAAVAALHHVVFDAGVFSDPSQNVVVQTPAYRAIGRLNPAPFRSDLGRMPEGDDVIFAPALLTAYDYVVVVHPEHYPAALPAQLVKVAAAGPAALYRIDH